MAPKVQNSGGLLPVRDQKKSWEESQWKQSYNRQPLLGAAEETLIDLPPNEAPACRDRSFLNQQFGRRGMRG